MPDPPEPEKAEVFLAVVVVEPNTTMPPIIVVTAMIIASGSKLIKRPPSVSPPTIRHIATFLLSGGRWRTVHA
jgi:hypothetical protein